MEEFSSLWSYQENIDELKQKLLYTTLELAAVKEESSEEIKRNTESMKKLLDILKIVCQERDEAKDQLQMLQNKIMASNDQQMFNPAANPTNPSGPNCFEQAQLYNQGPLMIPNKPHSSITESNSLSDAYNRSSSPVDSFFDPISSPEFSNVNVETPFGQDYDQTGGFANRLENGRNGPKGPNGPKVDQATLVMESMIKGKTLPQKGNLLKAVVEAGPLLQTLLLAGPLPTWRNPPSLKAFHAPPTPMVATPAHKQDIGLSHKLSKSSTMMMIQSQPYAEMACGSSSQMMAGGGASGGGGGGGGGVLSFGDGYIGGHFQGMVAAYPGGSNLGPFGKRQRLH